MINVILKKDFKGTYAMGTGGTTTKGGGTTWDAQLMQGFGDVSAGLGGWAALEYRSQEAIKLSQRRGEPWAVTDYTPWGGNNLNPGAIEACAANPVIRGAPYLQSRAASTALAANNAFLNNNCDFARRNANQCQYDDTWSQIQPRSQNVNLIGNVTSRLGSDWSLSVTGSFFDQQSEQQWRPGTRSLPFASYAGVLTAGPNQIAQVGVNAVPSYTVPANYPGNPFGVPANVRAFSPISGVNQSHQPGDAVEPPRGAGDGHGVGLGHDGLGGLHECQAGADVQRLALYPEHVRGPERPGASATS